MEDNSKKLSNVLSQKLLEYLTKWRKTVISTIETKSTSYDSIQDKLTVQNYQ